LALFGSLQQKETTESIQFPSVRPWVEQVEYRQLNGVNSRAPSLDQITAHLSSQAHSAASTDEHRRPPIPLPTFLRTTSRIKATPDPLDLLSDSVCNRDNVDVDLEFSPEVIHAPIPKTAGFPDPSQGPELEVITMLVPRSSSSTPTELTENNLTAFNSRTLTGRDMVSKLKRRTAGVASAEGLNGRIVDEDERRLRRISAPAELPMRERDGFAHPVLTLPGAF